MKLPAKFWYAWTKRGNEREERKGETNRRGTYNEHRKENTLSVRRASCCSDLLWQHIFLLKFKVDSRRRKVSWKFEEPKVQLKMRRTGPGQYRRTRVLIGWQLQLLESNTFDSGEFIEQLGRRKLIGNTQSCFSSKSIETFPINSHHKNYLV